MQENFSNDLKLNFTFTVTQNLFIFNSTEIYLAKIMTVRTSKFQLLEDTIIKIEKILIVMGFGHE